MTQNEINLVNAAKGGDSRAFEELYVNYYNKVFALARMTLKNESDAEDILQQAFINAWRNLGSLTNPAAFNTWLQKITLNLCHSLLRRKNIAILLDAESDISDFSDIESDELLPAVYAERDDLRYRLGKIIEGLSDVQKQTITLYYFSELNVEEIAYIMDCSAGTVKTRLFLARKAIRAEVEEQERISGQKFYGVTGIAMLGLGQLLARQIGAQTLSPAASAGILQNISHAIAQGAINPTQAVAATSVGGVAAKTGVSLAKKLIAGVVAAAVVTGGGIAVWQLTSKKEVIEDPVVQRSPKPSAENATIVGIWDIDSVMLGEQVIFQNGEYADALFEEPDLPEGTEWAQLGTSILTYAKWVFNEDGTFRIELPQMYIDGIRSDRRVYEEIMPGLSGTWREVEHNVYRLLINDSDGAESTLITLSGNRLVAVVNVEWWPEDWAFTFKPSTFEPQKRIVSIAAGDTSAVWVYEDGTVGSTVPGDNSDSQDYLYWSDIIQIAAEYIDVIGLRRDGTVMLYRHSGLSDDEKQAIEEWSDVIQVVITESLAAALGRDGTVVSVGRFNDNSDVSEWKDIVQIYAASERVVGLRADGTVVTTSLYQDVSGLTDIEHVIETGYYGPTLGLRSDGRVIMSYEYDTKVDTSSWGDISQIAAIRAGERGGVVGLKEDGTVVYTDNLEEHEDVQSWTDIVEIDCGQHSIVGLTSDGTIVTNVRWSSSSDSAVIAGDYYRFLWYGSLGEIFSLLLKDVQ